MQEIGEVGFVQIQSLLYEVLEMVKNAGNYGHSSVTWLFLAMHILEP